MASLDIFNADPFTTIQLTEAVERIPYLPMTLGALDLFEPKPIRTKVLMVEQRQGKLVLVPFSDRGAPGTQRTTEQRSARHFQVPRIRMAEDGPLDHRWRTDHTYDLDRNPLTRHVSTPSTERFSPRPLSNRPHLRRLHPTRLSKSSG